MIQVLLVDDHEVVREGLKVVFQSQDDIHVAGESGSIAEAVEAVGRLQPTVVLLDVRLPDGEGYTACGEIRRLSAGTKILVLTSYTDPDLVYDAVAAGVDGVILKRISQTNLCQAIRDVSAGKTVIEPELMPSLFERISDRDGSRDKNRLGLLSRQELRVLSLIAKGRTNKEVAQAMTLSEKTVRNYFSNVLDKLNVSRRTEAVAYYATHHRD